MPWFPFDPPDGVPALPPMDLTDEQAEDLHRAYVAAHPHRLERLKDRRGEQSEGEPTYDAEGLRDHWAQLVAHPPPAAPRWTEDDVVPFWARQFAEATTGITTLSARALLDADLLAAHMSETALRCYPEARWAIRVGPGVPTTCSPATRSSGSTSTPTSFPSSPPARS